MNNINLHNEMFDTLLKVAIQEEFKQELDDLPDEAELEQFVTLSPELDNRVKKLIANRSRKLIFRKIGTISKKAAVILAILICLCTVGLLSVEAVRVKIFNAILDWKHEYVDIRFEEHSSSDTTQNSNADEFYTPFYIPEGFYEEKSFNIGNTFRTEYLNDIGVSIIFDQMPLEDMGTVSIDTENMEYSEITVNGQKASLFEGAGSEDKSILVWSNSTTGFTILSGVDKDELIKMAENITISQK